ncbi:prominin-1-A-like [Asterias amurensis]|uniref:prominin-1-A-like n=1 Tax=Asterias amurensis TaxID=7602 RepID=UPI003AB5C785
MAATRFHTAVATLATLFITLQFFVSVSAQKCSLNPDGEIDWGNLPSLGAFKTAVNYEEDGERRGTLSDLARGFVNTVTPNFEPLLDYIAELIQRLVYDQETFDAWVEVQKVLPLTIGIIVCLCVGVVYLILVPIIGIIFGCCRCCNNCGGKRVQEDSSCPGCLRVYYTIFLLCITGVLCAGMAYTNFSNDFIGHSYDTAKPGLINITEDGQTFLTGALEQVEYITDDEYDTMYCLVSRDLNNVGNEIADPLLDYLKEDAGLQDTMDAFQGVTSGIDSMYVALDGINSSRSEVIDGTAEVKSLLVKVKGDLDELTSCTGCPDTTSLAMVEDYNSIPVVDTQLNQALVAKTLADGFYNEFEGSLNNISTIINDKAQPAVGDVIAELDTLNATVKNSFKLISDAFKQVNKTLKEDVQDTLESLFKTADDYSNYRYYGLIGVTCLTLLIVLFNVIGIAMGSFAYKDVLPTERTRMSNAGGNVLIAGVFFSLLFGPILILICMVMFTASGTGTLSCEPLASLQIFEKTIDQPDYISDGYFLGEQLLQNSSINLTASSILTQCQEDATLYTALQYSTIFTVDEVQKQLDEAKLASSDKLKSAIVLPNIDLYDPTLESSLTGAVDSIDLGSIDPDTLKMMLDTNVTVENLNEFASKLDIESEKTVNIAIKEQLQNISLEIRRIQNDFVTPIDVNKMLIVYNAEVLYAVNKTLTNNISSTASQLSEVDKAVNSNNTEVQLQNITIAYVDTVFGYADQFVAHIDDQLEKDLAQCKPVRDLYDSGVNLLCYYAFDSLNTLWFTTGWCAIFILFSIFLAVKLAKFYRIMDEEALPKVKKSKKGASSRGLSDQEMALEDMSEDGHTGHDNIRLVESIRQQGGMQPQQNPHYIPDDVINGYDSYNNLGRPMAPPPAYHPGFNPQSMPPAAFNQQSMPPAAFNQQSMPPAGFNQRSMPPAGYNQRIPPVNTPYDSYDYDYDYVQEEPIQRRNRESVMADMQQYNKKPRVPTYL